MKRTKLRQNIIDAALILRNRGEDTFTLAKLHDLVGSTPTRIWNEVWPLCEGGLLSTTDGEKPRKDGKFIISLKGMQQLVIWRNEMAKQSRKPVPVPVG